MILHLNVILGCTILLLNVNNVLSQPRPVSGYLGGVELRYGDNVYLFVEERMDPFGAALYCDRYGGELVVVTGAPLENFLKDAALGTLESREFLISFTTGSVFSILDMLRSQFPPTGMVNCSDPANSDFCALNTEGPHYVQEFQDEVAASCLNTSSCFDPGNPTTFNGMGAPYISSSISGVSPIGMCAVIQFSGDDIEWQLISCLSQNSFICQKRVADCPAVMEVPEIPESPVPLNSSYTTFLGTRYLCGESDLAVSVNYCAAQYLDLQDPKLGTCGFNLSLVNVISAAPSSCGATISTQDNDLILQWNLVTPIGNASLGSISTVINRRSCITQHLQCKYPFKQNVSAENFLSNADQLLLHNDYQKGRFLGFISRYTDNTYTQEIRDYSNVTVPDPIYIGVDLEFTNDKMIVQAINCFALDYDCFCSGVVYPMILDGCSNDTEHVRIAANSVHQRTLFEFDSFLWTSLPPKDQLIFVTCEMRVCDSSLEPCTLECPDTRNKRSIPPSDEKKLDYNFKVTSEPIHVVSSSDAPCFTDNGGCSHTCTDNNGQAECSCPFSMYLDDEKRNCLTITEEFVESLDLNDKDKIEVVSQTFFIVTLAAVLLGVLLLVIIRKRRVSKRKSVDSDRSAYDNVKSFFSI